MGEKPCAKETYVDFKSLLTVVKEVDSAGDDLGSPVGRVVGHLRGLNIIAALRVKPHGHCLLQLCNYNSIHELSSGEKTGFMHVG